MKPSFHRERERESGGGHVINLGDFSELCQTRRHTCQTHETSLIIHDECNTRTYTVHTHTHKVTKHVRHDSSQLEIGSRSMQRERETYQLYKSSPLALKSGSFVTGGRSHFALNSCHLNNMLLIDIYIVQ